MTRLIFCIGALVSCAAVSLTAHAAVIGGSATGGSAVTNGGVFVNLGFNPIPVIGDTIGDDNQQNNNLYAFNEDQNIVLTPSTGAVSVDFCADSSVCGSGLLPIGTTVASHYVFLDPVSTQVFKGTVTFDAPILAVMDSKNNMAASDFLINNNITYLSDNLRGLESADSYSVSGATITLSFQASSPGDYIRVLTAFSPVADAVLPGPGAILLLGFGIAGLALGRRKKI